MATQKKGGKKGRKVGRNEARCKRYRVQNRREKNKLRRMRKHVLRNPEDTAAKEALETYGLARP